TPPVRGRSIGRAEPHASAQESLWVDGLAIDAGLVVEVRAGRAAGRSDPANDLANLDLLSDGDLDRRKVAVARGEPVAMVDLDHLAVPALPAGGDHLAVGGGAHRIAGLGLEIEPGMHRGLLDERIHAHAEARRQIRVARHRLAHRHIAERASEALDLTARDADPMDLPLE